MKLNQLPIQTSQNYMILPKDKTKYLAKFRYVELGHYVDNLNKLIRDKKNDKPLLIDYEEIEEYAEKHKRYGIFQSVFQYDAKDIDSAASVGPLFFDIDSDDIEVSRVEAFKLVEYLLSYISENGIRAYFSGQKGFHIECEPIALGFGPDDDLPRIFRFIAGHISEELGLTGIDYHVYDRRRMWRVPNTLHQRTGLFKVECLQLLRSTSDIGPILKLAEQQNNSDLPLPTFEPKAHMWFKDLQATWELNEAASKKYYSSFDNFLKTGVDYRSNEDQHKIFNTNLNDMFNHCEAIKNLYEKARTQHTLEHYERLFLCSLFTYTDEAIEFLHKEILSQCDDYNFVISDSHIKDWVRRREAGTGGRPFTCSKARQIGIICRNCDDLKPKQKIINGYNTGAFSDPSPVRFAYKYIDHEMKEF